MKIKEIIAYVDQVKPNAFTSMQKTMWLNEVEGMVQTDVLLLPISSVITYVYGATWFGEGLKFPDDATMVFPSAPDFRPGGLVTITGLSDYDQNNISALAIYSVSDDGKTLAFAENTFADTGTAAETGEASVVFDGSETEMLVPAPFHKIYYTYLMAMIDFANGEYNKYQNTMALFNSFFGSFMRWYAQNYKPSDTEQLLPGHYF